MTFKDIPFGLDTFKYLAVDVHTGQLMNCAQSLRYMVKYFLKIESLQIIT